MEWADFGPIFWFCLLVTIAVLSAPWLMIKLAEWRGSRKERGEQS